MRKQVMILAHAVHKTGIAFSEAQKKAWAALKIKADMMIKPVSFFYQKDKGEERFAVGYYGDAPATESKKEPKPTSILAIPYWDQLVGGWRSFRVDRLIIN